MSFFSLLSVATIIGITGCLFDYNKNQNQSNRTNKNRAKVKNQNQSNSTKKNRSKVKNPNDGIGLHQLQKDYITLLKIANLANINEKPPKSFLNTCRNCANVRALDETPEHSIIDESPKKKTFLSKLNVLKICAFSPRYKTVSKPKEESTKRETDDKSKEPKCQKNNINTEKESSDKSKNTNKAAEKEQLATSENCDKVKEQLAKCEKSEKDLSTKPAMTILEELQKNKSLSNKLQALIERVVKLNHTLKTFQPMIVNVKNTLCKLQKEGIFLPVMMKRVDNMDTHTHRAQPMLLEMIAALQNLADDEIRSDKYEIKEIEDHMRAMDEMMQTVTSVSNKLNDLLLKVTGFEKVLSSMCVNEEAKANAPEH